MAALISHPFRLAPGGGIALVEDTTDQYIAEQLAMLVLTRPGERPLVPDLGLADPTFVGFDASSLQEQVDAFAPPCRVVSVDMDYTGSASQQVQITFDRGSDEAGGGDDG